MIEVNNITTMQMDLTNVVKDVYNKIKGIREKYADHVGSIPPVPEFLTITRIPAEYYRYYAECLHIGDEIICVSTQLSMVVTSLSDIRNTGLTRDITNEYSLMNGFRKFLDQHIENLNRYKYDLIEIQRQVTNRIKLLQAISFHQ